MMDDLSAAADCVLGAQQALRRVVDVGYFGDDATSTRGCLAGLVDELADVHQTLAVVINECRERER